MIKYIIFCIIVVLINIWYWYDIYNKEKIVYLWVSHGPRSITIQRLTGKIGKPPIIYEATIDGNGHGTKLLIDCKE